MRPMQFNPGERGVATEWQLPTGCGFQHVDFVDAKLPGAARYVPRRAIGVE